MKYYFTACFLLFSSLTVCQSQFSLSAYNNFLQKNKDLSTSSFYQLHDAGLFRGSVAQSLSSAQYADAVTSQLTLTEYEKELIAKNGFMVSQRLSQNSFSEGFIHVFNKDLPLFISTDAILHAYHISYDKILKDFELNFLIQSVCTILNKMHEQIPVLEARYASEPRMKMSLKDVDVYLTVPRTIFSKSAAPYYTENVSEVSAQLNNIESYTMKTVPLFSAHGKIIDFSQFKPRGHYVDISYPELANYFKVMMWLGRIEIYLMAPQSASAGAPAQDFSDIQRQTIDAYVIQELIELSQTASTIQEVEDFLKFFIGEQDNVTTDNLSYLQNAVQLQKASDLLDSLKLVTFQDTLKNQSFAGQKILSQILYGDPMSPDKIVPASSFLLFGQRFVIDSYVSGSVVFDKISYQGSKITRMLPSTLDILFALGNNAAGQLLQPEIEQYHYASNLAALRYLVNSYDESFWTHSLYNCWLAGIRTLNAPENRSTLPLFMQTGAYWQEKMNTQLASWTELRHDNLLYAKQSYTGGTTCSYPYAYIEPFPELYKVLKNIADIASQKINTYTFTDPYGKQALLFYYNSLYTISDTMAIISEKELNGTPLSDQENNFLKSVLYQTSGGCGPTYNGWYQKLLYQSSLFTQDFIVADYHTAPTDASGAPVGWVKHAGTGPVELGVFVTSIPNVGDVAFTGPVSSYYEYTTTGFTRLTDQEWASSYLSQAARPSFVNLYLSDASGATKGDGLKLLTDTNEPPVNQVSNYIMKVSNYPNPFNSTTIIHFTVPPDATAEPIELAMYDINGRLVDKIMQQPVPSGNYVVRWSPKTRTGMELSSGVYVCQLKAGTKIVRHKLSYLK